MTAPTTVCARTLDDLPPLWDITPFTVREMDMTWTVHQDVWHTIIHASFPAKEGGWKPTFIGGVYDHPVYDITHTYFLMDGEKYIGVCSEGVFRLNHSMGVPHYIGIDPAYQGQKLGKWLLLYVLHQLKAHGLAVCEGESTMEHQTALTIHFALGMRPKYVKDVWNSPGPANDDYQRLFDTWQTAQAHIPLTSDFYLLSGGGTIPLSYPPLNDASADYVSDVLTRRKLSSDGTYTRRCQEWLETTYQCPRALLTHSGTGALELAALLTNIGPGDEVIMPSFTYPTTASAFVLRGATPVFVDIRPDTLNMDETLIAAAITDRTKAIVPVHYGGVFCNMDAICEIAHRHGLYVIEDAAQSLGSTPPTQRGHLSIFSFHDTKNIVCGEGGALLIHDDSLVERADILWFCGTDRRQFLEGRVEQYTWQDIGSSFGPSELQAAVLWSQLEVVDNLTAQHREIWQQYHAAFKDRDIHQRPTTGHNAHLYYLLVPANRRAAMLDQLHRWGVGASFHYVPLHSSPAGRKYGRVSGSMNWTNQLSQQIIRLPLYVGNQGMYHTLVHDIIQKCKAVL